MVGLVVHEWIEAHGGSERVLEAIADTFPSSDIMVPWNNAPERSISPRVTESWLARTPIRRSKAVAAVALPAVWRTVVDRRKEYEWVIASSHLFSHHVRATGSLGNAPKYVYVHSPARYIWNPELDDRGSGFIARSVGAALKPVDRHRAQEAHAIAANSSYVQKRVENAWHRDAVVIHPPVDVDKIVDGRGWFNALSDEDRDLVMSLPEQFVLGASRFVSYKRLDLAIQAGEAADLPVVLAGDGPLLQDLRVLAEQADVPVYIIKTPSNPLLYALYERASVYLFPPVEDFGIMPVEAMAAGVPVIANSTGGARESVQDGLNGILLDRFSRSALKSAVQQALSLDRATISTSVAKFSVAHFQDKIRRWVGQEV